MSAIVLTVPGADFSSTGLGKFYSLPDIRTSLFAAYLFGTGAGIGAGLHDLTGNGRDAVLSAGTPGVNSIQCSAANFLTLPFTPNQVIAANGEITTVVIGKAPAGQGSLVIGNYGTKTAEYIEVVAPTNNTIEADNGTIKPFTVADAARAANYEMYAGAYSATSALAYRGSASLSQSSGATKTAATWGGATAMRIGDTGTGYTTSTLEAVAALVYSKALTAAELDSVRASMTTLLAGLGITL